MKNFNDDAAILRSGSGNQLPHLVHLAETAKDFFQTFASSPWCKDLNFGTTGNAA